MHHEKRIVIVSDGTGHTAQRLMDAVLVQYYQAELEYSLAKIHPEVRTATELNHILEDLNSDNLVLFSIISEDLSRYFEQQLTKGGILYLNVLSPMLDTISKFLGVHPEYRPGLLQVVDDSYYRKIDAIGFTVEHDDGRGHSIHEADVVLLGLSRTCKTPVSMYLACNYGLKVANMPVIRDGDLTKNLLIRIEPVDHNRIIGLIMQPEVLAHVREERFHLLASEPDSTAELREYYDVGEVARESQFCRDLYNSRQWRTLDVTRRAIEEISIEVLDKLGRSR